MIIWEEFEKNLISIHKKIRVQNLRLIREISYYFIKNNTFMLVKYQQIIHKNMLSNKTIYLY